MEPETTVPFCVNVAVMVVVPTLIALATPSVLMVAMVGVDDDHVTWPERFMVLPSLNVPIAVNAWVPPCVTVGLGGVTAIDVRVRVFTVKVALPVCPANTAVMLVVPGATPIAIPPFPKALLIVPIPGTDEAHVTLFVTFCVLRSANVPMAVNCVETASGTEADGGVIAIDVKGDGVTSTLVLPLFP